MKKSKFLFDLLYYLFIAFPFTYKVSPLLVVILLLLDLNVTTPVSASPLID